MLDLMNIGSKFFMGRQVIMLGVFRADAGSDIVQALWVNKIKSDIRHEKFASYTSLKHFVGDYEANYSQTPIVLCIDDENLIFENNPDAVTVFESKDFLIEDSDELKFYSIVRKSQIESYFTELGQHRKSVVRLCMGPVQALNWVEDLNLEKPYFLGSNQVSIEESSVKTEISREAHSTVLDNESLSPVQLLLFLTSFSFFLQPHLSTLEEIKRNVRELVFSNVLKKLLLVGGGFVFTVLLLSSALFFYYDAENEQLNERYYEQNIIQTKVEKYRTDIARLEDILNSGNRVPVFSRLASDIARGLPASISLKELTVFPADLTEMKRRKRVNARNEMVIVGQSNTMREVSDWVSSVKDLVWVEDIVKNEIDKVEAGFLIKMTISVADVE